MGGHPRFTPSNHITSAMTKASNPSPNNPRGIRYNVSELSQGGKREEATKPKRKGDSEKKSKVSPTSNGQETPGRKKRTFSTLQVSISTPNHTYPTRARGGENWRREGRIPPRLQTHCGEKELGKKGQITRVGVTRGGCKTRKKPQKQVKGSRRKTVQFSLKKKRLKKKKE